VKTKLSLALFVLPVAVSQMGATDCGQIIKDPGFDLWCGDRLCDWKTERGQIKQVPTWHAGDDGVELVGGDVAISQATFVNSGDGTCIEFSMLTNIASDAEVHLQFDVFGDGTVDHDERVPTAGWAPVSYKVLIAPPFNGVTFRLTKTGPGQAVLAEIKAEISGDCPGAPIALPPRPNGGWCYAGADCASGTCNGVAVPFGPHPVCGGCASSADCAPGTACSVEDTVPPWLDPFQTCLPDGSRRLGEQCVGDGECSTGHCTGGVCSACVGTCADGRACRPVDDGLLAGGGAWTPPTTCGPNQGDGIPGSTCFTGADCLSGACAGTPLSICADDGRTCTSSVDCPVDQTLAHHACVAVGTPGGTCQ
jgi:hypothetical protein